MKNLKTKIMKATELRIGNYFNQNTPGDNAVDIIAGQDILDLEVDPLDDFFQPIPLTEDWLIKFGFEWIDEASGYFNKLHAVYLWASGLIEFHPFCTNDEDCQINIKYVHQLQNICFALTGEELTIK